MLRFKFNEAKAIAAVLFICHRLITGREKTDIHKISKILYFADQKHLAQYGRPITGDHYVAMNYGPVPSRIYDIFKTIRGDSICTCANDFSKHFNVTEHFVLPKEEPDMEELSDSDFECIVQSLTENEHLDFGTLMSKSHDSAYEKAAKDDRISFREMAKLAGANEDMLGYIKTKAENDSIFSK